MPTTSMQAECDKIRSSGDECRRKFSGGNLLVVATDMDGTILDPKHRLTERTKDTLYELSTRGVHIIFATGRHHSCVYATRRDLLEHYRRRSTARGVPDSPTTGYEGFYIISSNGARVHNPNGDLIFLRDLDSDIVRVLYERFGIRDHGDDPRKVLSVSAYQTEKWWINRTIMSDEESLAMFGVVPDLHPDLLKEFPTTGVGKVCFRCYDRDILHQYEAEIKELFHGRATAVMSSEICLDVMAAGVSKAAALREIGRILNFDPEREAIAFGDSMNDGDMLCSVAKGCIMGNGQSRLKESLPHLEVVGSSSEDGVARKLQEVFQIFHE
ncbi:putative haloacid dehalogenase hydrolase [Trypanosoma cruzi]|nr:putative haloacid dehalogenase hydrolase [Trypanosoma cruzi]